MASDNSYLKRIAESTEALAGTAPITYYNLDLSGVVISGGQSQELAPNDTKRVKLIIQAFKTNTEEIWINLNDPASNTFGSISLEPGDLIRIEPEEAFNAINVFSVNAGQAYTAKGTQIATT